MGELILNIKKQGQVNEEIDISDLPSGIYFIKIFQEENVFARKIIKTDI